ncbi:hypothetical protein MBLNU230_g0307t1 [Neophaeotheca triangularis]
MATKRSAPGVHPSRVSQVPNQPSAKRRKPNPHPSGQSFKKSHTVNDLKSSIRSLTRLLNSETADLPANVRVEKERALQSAKHELEETQRDKRKKDMIGRYHKVRFFDRQKATKRLKRFTKVLKGAEDEGEDQGKIDELKKAVEEAQIEINYAIYYPLEEPYSALFPSKKRTEDEDGIGKLEADLDLETGIAKEQARQGDENMWELVKNCTKDGTLESLRNGKLTSKAPEPVPESAKTKTKPKVEKKVKNQTADRESDDESDGGFFE